MSSSSVDEIWACIIFFYCSLINSKRLILQQIHIWKLSWFSIFICGMFMCGVCNLLSGIDMWYNPWSIKDWIMYAYASLCRLCDLHIIVMHASLHWCIGWFPCSGDCRFCVLLRVCLYVLGDLHMGLRFGFSMHNRYFGLWIIWVDICLSHGCWHVFLVRIDHITWRAWSQAI